MGRFGGFADSPQSPARFPLPGAGRQPTGRGPEAHLWARFSVMILPGRA
jgi:hypothetical protein